MKSETELKVCSIKIPKALEARLQSEAAADGGRSFGSLVRKILEDYCRQRDAVPTMAAKSKDPSAAQS